MAKHHLLRIASDTFVFSPSPSSSSLLRPTSSWPYTLSQSLPPTSVPASQHCFISIVICSQADSTIKFTSLLSSRAKYVSRTQSLLLTSSLPSHQTLCQVLGFWREGLKHKWMQEACLYWADPHLLSLQELPPGERLCGNVWGGGLESPLSL